MQKLPIVYLSPVLVAIASITSFGGVVMQDGKVDFKDLPELFSALPKFAGFAQLKPVLAGHEALNIDEVEKATLVSDFKKELDLPSDVKEELVEQMVDATLTILVGVGKVLVLIEQVKSQSVA